MRVRLSRPNHTKMNRPDYLKPFVNDDFPGREEGIEHKKIYRYEDCESLISIGYSGYNWWRNELAKLAGYPLTNYRNDLVGLDEKRYDAGAWNAESGPFWELILFSDCEGVIGPIVSMKLLADFAAFKDKAALHPDDRFRKYYDLFHQTFETASDNGAVVFQ